MFLELQIEVISPENPLIVGDTLADVFFTLSCGDMLWNLSEDRSREPDEVTLVLFQELEIDARTPVVHTIEPRFCDHVDEVFVPLYILGEQYNLEEFVVLITIISTFLRYHYLDTDDGINSCFFGFFIELERSVEIP